MNLPRLFRTLVHLKPCQLWFQVYRRLQRRLGPHPACATAELPPLTFLNLTARAQGWNDPSLDMLWRYNLHYFDTAHELIPRWLRENPRGSVPGWDPYPTSLRIVNWVKLLSDPAACAAIPGFDAAAVERSLADQLAWLRDHLEWHILANHLLANLKAMAIGTAFLARGASAESPAASDAVRWLARYVAELSEQVLDDGGHFERSVMYHAIMFEDVLDVLQWGRADAQKRVPPALVEKMLRYLVAMTGPDGQIVLFNDAAPGIAKPTAELVARAARAGFGQGGAASDGSRPVADFPTTGYVRAEVGDWVLYADIAPLGPDFQPGHAHADTLTYELYHRGEKVVTDVGTSAYRGPNRAFERSTAAHNVVQVDGRDSSEVWSSHRVGHRARVVRREVAIVADGVELVGAYESAGVRVERTWRLTAAGLAVTERVQGGRSCTTRVHFAPGMEGRVSVDFASPRREEYQFARAFGLLEPAVGLAADFDPSTKFCYNIRATT